MSTPYNIGWKNHPQDNIARFGYILNMKINKKSESFYILRYLLELIFKNLAMWIYFFFEIWIFGTFFHEKSFVYK
jgi:hypothetical protein